MCIYYFNIFDYIDWRRCNIFILFNAKGFVNISIVNNWQKVLFRNK